MMWAWIVCACITSIVALVCYLENDKDNVGDVIFFTIIFIIFAGIASSVQPEKPIEHPNGEHCNT